MTLKSEMQTMVRRIAAKIISDYPAPPLSHSKDLFDDLEAAAGSARVEGAWATLVSEISAALQMQGVDQFLRLPPIARTLHPRIRSPGRRYVAYLSGSSKFSAALHKALTESPVGKPLLSPYYPLSSPLLLQHGYHLVRLLEATDFDLAGVRLVVEFGGGYGGFFRLLRNLEYRDRYVICDLPAMCALQRFYLRNLFPTEPGARPPANVQWISKDVAAALQRETASSASWPSLFIATWSLSETPLTVRNEVASVLDGFTYILCAYQRSFGGYDNVQYFEALQKQLPQFAWRRFECPVYRGNFYLIGQRQRAGEP
ncbi:MAG TPA: putative sugar O-methyltransferase [Steroidobacteraceae bacterium]|nr:putative sugar O-methyltransferase [Steroidobacteraceae bacterium]